LSLTVSEGGGERVAAAPAAVLGPRAALRSAVGLPSDGLWFCGHGLRSRARAVTRRAGSRRFPCRSRNHGVLRLSRRPGISRDRSHHRPHPRHPGQPRLALREKVALRHCAAGARCPVARGGRGAGAGGWAGGVSPLKSGSQKLARRSVGRFGTQFGHAACMETRLPEQAKTRSVPHDDFARQPPWGQANHQAAQCTVSTAQT
jgi:hypothetical protein